MATLGAYRSLVKRYIGVIVLFREKPTLRNEMASQAH
jgi:hypothetical protein